MRSVARSLRLFFLVPFLSFGFLFSLAANAQLETVENQLRALEEKLGYLETRYGLQKFKDQHLGINIKKLRAKYSRMIREKMTPEEAAGLVPRVSRTVLSPEDYVQIEIALAADLKDGHTNILRQTDELWWVGIKTAAVAGSKLVVTGIDTRDYVDMSMTGTLKIGDEILEVNGEPVAEIAKRNMLYQQRATFRTRMDGALQGVLNRSHKIYRSEKTGAQVNIKFKDVQTGEIKEGSFQWIATHERKAIEQAYLDINPQERIKRQSKRELENGIISAEKSAPFIFGDRGLKSQFSEGLRNAGATDYIVEIGDLLNLKIANEQIKSLAENGSPTTASSIEKSLESLKVSLSKTNSLKDLQPTKSLDAYTIRWADPLTKTTKTFGVLRIPHYSPEDGIQGVINNLRWISEVLKKFDKTTDGLIIDQAANGGGYVLYVTYLLSLLSPEEMEGVSIDLLLTNAVMQSSQRTDHDIDNIFNNGIGDAALYQLREVLAKVIREKKKTGKNWSGPIPFMGNNAETDTTKGGKISPAGSAFQGPIMILTDNRAASGGDFTPAILQQNGRAVVFGQNSMGLGAPVFQVVEDHGRSQTKMRCAYGSCERKRTYEGIPLENVGVVVDIERRITQKDVAGGFAQYAMDVLQTMSLLTSGIATIEQAQESLYLQNPSERPESLSLPEQLLKSDVILNSLRRKDEIVDRLAEMANNLPRYSKKTAAGKLVRSTLGGIRAVDACLQSVSVRRN